jgi:glycosyltransferase involved in cell wall biosynthesis
MNPERIRVDFIQGLTIPAPGLFRAQEPLVRALEAYTRYDVSLLRFSTISPRLWFPYLYGPIPMRLTLRHASLVHVGNGWYGHLVPLLRSPAIVTCHDLIELEESRTGLRRLRPHRRFHIEAAFRGMLRARFIACVSQATADAVIAHAPWTANRVRVIHSGLSPLFQPGPMDDEILRRLEIERPYVLYVGSEQPRKNLTRVAAAIAEARRIVPSLHFVKVGASQTPEGRADFLDAIQRAQLGDVTHLIEHVSDHELLMLYRGATATLLVSLAEGFGFPALEAMGSGCPVIVSDIAALREITGGNALVVDPRDIRSLALALERMISDPVLQRDLAERGRSWAHAFTWERAARAYGELYDEALAAP